jgi:carboxymethylenebutenolidase
VLCLAVLSELKNVTFASGSGMTPAFEGGKRTKPAVIVMQEW